ncbi:hypothetical protein [Caballeronia sp. GAWG2-1]|uniref:hypothetical protein n=1 Tax=Caballeronia sp. GAWG2-1 TaxID=2921744 RepID=UPI00202977DC|nr:hypothetical protein [Caballeronia sp. GAWG2-1]
MFIVPGFDWYEVSTRSRKGDGTGSPAYRHHARIKKSAFDADKNARRPTAYAPRNPARLRQALNFQNRAMTAQRTAIHQPKITVQRNEDKGG